MSSLFFPGNEETMNIWEEEGGKEQTQSFNFKEIY